MASKGEEGGWSLPAVMSDTVQAIPIGWRAKAARFLAHFIGTKMPDVANEIADHIDTAAGRSLIRHELAKAAAAKAINSPEMVDRTLRRLCGDLLDGQQNIEDITLLAAEEIVSDPTSPAEEDVANDWRRKFSGYAEDVSDAAMQQVWAKILAGEFRRPGSFSLKTLRVVSELNMEVANIFNETAKYRFAGNVLFLEPDKWMSGENLIHLKLLEDWGLIHETAGQRARAVTKDRNKYLIWGEQCCGGIMANTGPDEIELPIVAFTPTGKELLRLLPVHDEEIVMMQILDFLRKKVPQSTVGIVGRGEQTSDGYRLFPPFKFAWGDERALAASLQ